MRSGGEGRGMHNAMVLDLVMGPVLLVLEARLQRVFFTSLKCRAFSRLKES